MEKKTIGSFIATLRKANGMTQKTLAEKLNVSDKTISRWERDDGAPDLSVIPVIAEIFGVTCDELLRGEKRASNENADEQVNDGVYTAKAEKQRKWLIETTISKYKSKTTISIGIAIVGLLAAMIANFGFSRANIGFFVAIIFCLVSVVCQIIFNNEVKLSITNEDFSEDDTINATKQRIAKMTQKYFGVIVFLVGFVMPLIMFARHMYEGIFLITWCVYGMIIGVFFLLIYCIVCYFLKLSYVKRDIVVMDSKQKEKLWHNHELKKRYVSILLIVLSITFICMLFIELLPVFSVEGIDINDYESLVEVEDRIFVKNIIFVCLYIVESITICAIYVKKRKK